MERPTSQSAPEEVSKVAEEYLATHDLKDDETAYNERGEIRRGLLDENEFTEQSLQHDLHSGDD